MAHDSPQTPSISAAHDPPQTPSAPLPRRLGSVHLPEPLLYNDALLGRALRAVNDADPLDYPRRFILSTVLPHCRCYKTIERIIALDCAYLSTLADVLYDGLLLARSRGGRRRSGAVSVRSLADYDYDDDDDDDDDDGDAATDADVSTADPLHRLGEVLHLTHVIKPVVAAAGADDGEDGTSGSALMRRRAAHRDACIARQRRRCPITSSSVDWNIEACHIVPHSVSAKPSYSGCVFWFMLAVVLGEEWQRTVWDVVGGSKSWVSSNGIGLGDGLHRLFDKGMILLRPLPTQPDAQPLLLDVQFDWKTSDDTSRVMTNVASAIDDQIRSTGGVYRYKPTCLSRRINGGDRYRLFTNHPEECPLPSPVLLELHALLWTMIGASGMWETTREKSTRPFKRKRYHNDQQKQDRQRNEPGQYSRRGSRGGGGGSKQQYTGPGGALGSSTVDNQRRNVSGGKSGGDPDVSMKDDGNSRGWHSPGAPITISPVVVGPSNPMISEFPSSPPTSPASSKRSVAKLISSATSKRTRAPHPLGLKFSPWLFSQLLQQPQHISARKHSGGADAEASDDDEYVSTDYDSAGSESDEEDSDAGYFGQFRGWKKRNDATIGRSPWLRELLSSETR